MSLSALLLPLGPHAAETVCRALKTDKAFLKESVFLTEQAGLRPASMGEARLFKGTWGARYLADLIRLQAAFGQADARLTTALNETALYPTKISDLPVNGKDLEALGLHGPRLGQMLSRLLLSATEGDVKNTREALLEKAKAEIKEISV